MMCKFYDDYTGICCNGSCPMCADACPVPDADGVCKYEERGEEVYVLTPKGCAISGLMDAKLIKQANEPAVDVFWSTFSELMAKFGYIHEDSDG